MTLATSEFEKQAIAQQFGSAANQYHAQATLQRDCAQRLLDWVTEFAPELPAGDVLEVGCGTGFVTQGLIDRYGGRSLQITDLSPQMVEFCRTHLNIPALQTPLIRFEALDGEAFIPELSYALMVSGFAVQWFQQLIPTLQRWLKGLQPNGILALSFPGCSSFSTWQRVCAELELPFTANRLPDPNPVVTALSRLGMTVTLHTEVVPASFDSAADFFRAFKAIGANYNCRGVGLSTTEMRRLIRHWDHQQSGSITVDYHVHYLIAKAS